MRVGQHYTTLPHHGKELANINSGGANLQTLEEIPEQRLAFGRGDEQHGHTS